MHYRLVTRGFSSKSICYENVSFFKNTTVRAGAASSHDTREKATAFERIWNGFDESRWLAI